MKRIKSFVQRKLDRSRSPSASSKSSSPSPTNRESYHQNPITSDEEDEDAEDDEDEDDEDDDDDDESDEESNEDEEDDEEEDDEEESEEDSDADSVIYEYESDSSDGEDYTDQLIEPLPSYYYEAWPAATLYRTTEEIIAATGQPMPGQNIQGRNSKLLMETVMSWTDPEFFDPKQKNILTPGPESIDALHADLESKRINSSPNPNGSIGSDSAENNSILDMEGVLSGMDPPTYDPNCIIVGDFFDEDEPPTLIEGWKEQEPPKIQRRVTRDTIHNIMANEKRHRAAIRKEYHRQMERLRLESEGLDPIFASLPDKPYLFEGTKEYEEMEAIRSWLILAKQETRMGRPEPPNRPEPRFPSIRLSFESISTPQLEHKRGKSSISSTGTPKTGQSMLFDHFSPPNNLDDLPELPELRRVRTLNPEDLERASKSSKKRPSLPLSVFSKLRFGNRLSGFLGFENLSDVRDDNEQLIPPPVPSLKRSNTFSRFKKQVKPDTEMSSNGRLKNESSVGDKFGRLTRSRTSPNLATRTSPVRMQASFRPQNPHPFMSPRNLSNISIAGSSAARPVLGERPVVGRATTDRPETPDPVVHQDIRNAALLLKERLKVAMQSVPKTPDASEGEQNISHASSLSRQTNNENRVFRQAQPKSPPDSPQQEQDIYNASPLPKKLSKENRGAVQSRPKTPDTNEEEQNIYDASPLPKKAASNSSRSSQSTTKAHNTNNYSGVSTTAQLGGPPTRVSEPTYGLPLVPSPIPIESWNSLPSHMIGHPAFRVSQEATMSADHTRADIDNRTSQSSYNTPQNNTSAGYTGDNTRMRVSRISYITPQNTTSAGYTSNSTEIRASPSSYGGTPSRIPISSRRLTSTHAPSGSSPSITTTDHHGHTTEIRKSLPARSTASQTPMPSSSLSRANTTSVQSRSVPVRSQTPAPPRSDDSPSITDQSVAGVRRSLPAHAQASVGSDSVRRSNTTYQPSRGVPVRTPNSVPAPASRGVPVRALNPTPTPARRGTSVNTQTDRVVSARASLPTSKVSRSTGHGASTNTRDNEFISAGTSLSAFSGRGVPNNSQNNLVASTRVSLLSSTASSTSAHTTNTITQSGRAAPTKKSLPALNISQPRIPLSSTHGNTSASVPHSQLRSVSGPSSNSSPVPMQFRRPTVTQNSRAAGPRVSIGSQPSSSSVSSNSVESRQILKKKKAEE